jgi:hypothetical protein
VHYQRVEYVYFIRLLATHFRLLGEKTIYWYLTTSFFLRRYWRYQSTGQAKITLERIRRLQEIQFEWDPQRAKWNANYEKLVEFQREHGHCKVPKNWAKGPELANWVYVNFIQNELLR